MKKSQIRCIVGNALVLVASILTICLFALNMVEGVGRNSIFNEITTLNTFDGANKAFYMVAGISYIIILILTSVMVILGALGLIGGIFDIKGLNMTTANRSLSTISLILSALAMGMMITYVALLDVTAMIGAGVITTFLLAIVVVVGAFVAQSRKIYRV